jgi:retron-type reverse transcriptase
MSEMIDLGSFELNPELLKKQIKQDLKDDWFPDSLRFVDTLKPDIISEFLNRNIEKNNGRYIPENRYVLDVPKKGFTLRYSLETNIFDRIFYHGLAHYLIPFFDPLLSPRALSHRYADSGDRQNKYIFKHPIEQWKSFKGYIFDELERNPVLLVTDVQNYFENIQIAKVTALLEHNLSQIKASGADKGRLRDVISHLSTFLENCCYTKKHGLPQNRDASSFLANLIMLQVDTAMVNGGYHYYRYMDDMQIACSDKFEARRALRDLIIELRKTGLTVNSSKTEILEPGTEEYCTFVDGADPELETIDNMWKSRSLPVIRRSFEPLRNLALKLIHEKRTQDKGFRFCIKRFENLALCEEAIPPEEYFQPIIESVLHELGEQPYSSDQLVCFLKAVKLKKEHLVKIHEFLLSDKIAIYGWQNFLLWQLLVYKQYAVEELIAVAKKRVSESQSIADKAGATLYVGASGNSSDKEYIADNFPSMKEYILQRNALVAIHELEFSGIVKETVKPSVREDLQGTYSRLREGNQRGKYFVPLENLSYKQIYDEVSNYE